MSESILVNIIRYSIIFHIACYSALVTIKRPAISENRRRRREDRSAFDSAGLRGFGVKILHFRNCRIFAGFVSKFTSGLRNIAGLFSLSGLGSSG